MPSRPRILIAEPETLLVELCKELLATEFSVVGTVSDGRSLVQAAEQLTPDVILLCVTMPCLNGLDAGEQVKQSSPAVKLVYLTSVSDPQVVAEAFRRGASGYLLKTCTPAELLSALRDVLRGKLHISSQLPTEAIDFLRRQDKRLGEEERLTLRQREVLQLLAEGRVMKEIGNALNVTARTVAYHKYRIREVLGARTDAELIRYAVRSNIITA